MNLLKELHSNIKEDAAAGSISAGSVAVNQGAGFSRDESAIGSKGKKLKKKPIKRIFKEDKEYDKQSVMSQIKNAEETSNANQDVTGFALEDDTGNIVKVYVKNEQSEEFEKALNKELSNNQNDEHKHREIGEIVYELKNDFDIINIDMGTIPEDEEEIEEIKNSEGSDLEIEDDPEGDDEVSLDDKMEPGDADTDDSEENATSALTAVIDMMKSDAEARQADAEARQKESESRIAALNTQAAEAQVKKSEEVMDMEAHYNKEADKDKESKQLAKLAQYRHEISGSEETSDTDHIIDEPIPSEEEEEVKVSGKLLNAALTSLLRDRIKR